MTDEQIDRWMKAFTISPLLKCGDKDKNLILFLFFLLYSTAVPHPGGTTPLHLAAANDHCDCVKLLILNGADYNAVDEQCRTSLYIAAQKGYEACVHAHLDSAIWKDILSIPVKNTG